MSELAPSTQTATPPAVIEKPKTIGEFLASQKRQIEAALPKHLNADRMLRIVMTEMRKNPKLKLCTIPSIIGSVIQCAQLGLEPGGALGHAWLIPYDVNKNLGTKNAPNWVKNTECQFMIGYRGMIDLSRRSGQIISLGAHAVYENDLFDFEYGIHEKLKHIPNKGERGGFTAAYAIAHLVGGGHQIIVMFKNEIDAVRERSKSPDKGPWSTDYEEMAKKTTVRRLFKYLPVSIEIQRAVSLDEAADIGEQRNGLIIEGEIDDEFGDPVSKANALDKTLSD